MADRFLVTGAGGPAGRALLAQLAERAIPAIGVDMADADGLPVPVVRVPPSRDPGYLDALRSLVVEHGVTVVVPTVSEELPLVADASDAFGPGVRVIVAGAAAVRIADDKLATARALESAGVPVPRSLSAAELASPAEAAARIGFPLVAKPRISRGARGVRVVRSAGELGALDDGTILQSFAPGVEYAPVVYAPLDGSGAPFVAVLEKTGLSAGEVGNATGVRLVDGPGVADVARVAIDAVRTIGLVGPVDVDVRRDAGGTPRVLECNARFGANSRTAPALLEQLLLDLRSVDVGVP